VLPGFIDRHAGHVPVQMLLLALVSIAIGLLSDSACALAMIGVGFTVALTGRRS
jgi:threonine/homoserine/homoserine lactone efflux protein